MKNTINVAQYKVDVVVRDGSNAAHFSGAGKITAPVSGNDVVVIHAPSKAVMRYMRVGDDLLIYLEDGTVIECKDYFASADNKLAFEDEPGQFTHIIFDPSSASGEPVLLSFESRHIPSLHPLMETSDDSISPALLWGGLGLLGGGVVGAAAGGGGGNDDDNNDSEKSNTATGYHIGIDPVANGGVINNASSSQPLTITGTSDLPGGTAIIVNVNGTDYPGVTQPDGSWAVTLPEANVGALDEGVIPVTVEVIDPHNGNTVVTQTAISIVVDLGQPVISINPLGDNILNAAEVQQDQTLSGMVINARPGDVLVLTLNGHTYQAVVQADMSWQVTLPGTDLAALTEGEQPFSASIINASGNRGEAQGHLLVDTQAPSILIDNVTADNIINRDEHGQAEIISGTASDATPGDRVTVTVGGKTYTTMVDASGKWQIGIAAADVQALGEGTVTVSATIADTAGNTRTTTHDFLVDLTGPAVAINSVSGENIVDAHEQQQPLTLTGTCGADAVSVTVILNGKEYAAIVTGGVWSVTVPAADVANLADGTATVTAVATDAVGNLADATRNVVIDTKAPTITLDPVAIDNIINQAEHGAAVTISGASDVGEGKTVTVELNGKTYTAQTDAQGKWSVDVAKEDSSALAEGINDIRASVTDDAGNIGSKTVTVTVDSQPPTLSFEDILIGDDIINLAEHDRAQVISGSSSGLAEGSVVTVKLLGPNGYTKTFVTSVDDNGDWTIGLDAKTVRALANGDYTFTANAKDAAGNPAAQAEHAIVVDIAPPALAIVTTSAGSDDVLNKVEKQSPLKVDGTTDLADGSVVTVSFNGKTYTTDVTDGKWSLDIPVSDLSTLADGSYTLTVQAEDASGNTSSTSKAILVDTVTPAVVINSVTADNTINSAESTVEQAIHGKVINGAVGDIITVTLGDKTYTAMVNADLTWSVSVPGEDYQALENGKNTVTVTVTDNHGNVSDDFTHDFGVAIKSPTVTVDVISGDSVVNKREHEQTLVITGTAQDLASGDVITLVVTNGSTSKTYYGTVQSDGTTWSAVIPQGDVALWASGETLTVSATGKDVYGNTSAPATADALVNLNQVAVTVDKVASDDVINLAEATNPAGLKITGSTYNAADGDTITIHFAGKEYTTTVSNPDAQAYGSWSFTLPSADLAGLTPGNGNAILVELDSGSGNTAAAGHLVSYDPTPPTVLVNPVTGDNVLTASELGLPMAITGTASQDAAGQELTVTFNGKTYTTTVKSDGSWSLSVPSADLVDLSNGVYPLKAEVADAAGNIGVTDPLPEVNVRVSPPKLYIDPVSGDNYINAAEHDSSSNLVITGRTLDAEAGDEITLTFNGEDYKTTVKADGTWSLSVSAAVVKGLADGEVLVDASINDGHGNIGHATQTKVMVDTVKPLISIDTIATDNIINDDERAAESGLAITGTASNSEAGRTVTVTVTGADYSQTYITTLGTDGKWSLDVPHGDIANIASGAYTVTASITDKAGNEGMGTRGVLVDQTKPAITIDAFTGDDFVNYAEHDKPQIISGTTDVPAGKTVTVILGEGADLEKTYTATVTSDGKWSVTVPAADLAAFTDGNYRIVAKVDSSTGNHGSAERAVEMEVVAPTISFATNVAGADNIVNMQEQAAGIHVGGITSAEPGQTVTLKFNNGNSYTTTVSPDGSWAIDLPASEFATLIDGDYTITAVVIDKAGNSSEVAVKTVSLSDATSTLVLDAFTGDNLVNMAEKGAAQAISGTSSAEDGSTVTITLNGNTWTTTVADGKWSADISIAEMSMLTDGDYVISATVTNSIGNTTTRKSTITVDTTAPTQIITITSITDDRGSSATDYITNDTSLSIGGKLSAVLGADEMAQISLDNGATWSAVNVNGTSWSYTDSRTLPEGTVHYQVRVIDKAGNTGSEAAQDVVIDLTAPDNTISIISMNTDTGLYTDDFITSDTTLTLHGITEKALNPGESAQISLDGGLTWQALTVTGTDWTFDCGEQTASFTCKVRIVDEAGNEGIGDAQAITIDTLAPDDITMAIKSITDDTGIASDFKTKDTSLTVNGDLSRALASDERVQISMDGGTTWITATSTGTTWSYTDPRTLTDGSYIYDVRVVDLAGNVSPSALDSKTVIVDTVGPTVTAAIISITDDTGFSSTDFITNDTSLSVQGTLSDVLGANEWAEISVDGGATWTKVTLIDDTHWSYKDSRTLEDGDHTYKVRVTDDVGNTSDVVSQKVTVDTTAPTTTVIITNFTDDVGSAKGNYASGTKTDDTTPRLNGTINKALVAGEKVAILREGIFIGYATMSGATWTFTDELSALAANTYHYKAAVIDAAGNMGVTTADFNVLYSPVPGVVALVTNNISLDATPIISGTLDTTNGEFLKSFYLEVKINGKTYNSKDGTVVVDIPNKTWWVEIPDANALPGSTGGTNYTVTTTVKTLFDDTAGTSKTGTVTEKTPAAVVLDGSFYGYNIAYTINSNGSWTIADAKVYNYMDPTTVPTYSSRLNYYSNSSILADFNRDGKTDMLFTTDRAEITPVGLNLAMDISGASPANKNLSGRLQYSSLVLFDKNGDGYLEGMATTVGNSSGGSYWLDNTAGTITLSTMGGSATKAQVGTTVTTLTVGEYASAVDLNNDGKVDLAVHSNNGNAYAYSALINSGDGTFTWGQTINNFFYNTTGTSTKPTGMFWADFNNDGYMDLYIQTNYSTYGGVNLIYFNKGDGTLNTTATTVAGTNTNLGAYVTDWNHDGKMDIVKQTSGTSIQVLLNNGDGKGWTTSTVSLPGGSGVNNGFMLVDYDWDGDQDIFQHSWGGNNSTLSYNSNSVEKGTSLHFRILDKEGFNVFFGNTINLYDSQGNRVASQVINPQSGGFYNGNDTSGLVNFYGLDKNEAYSIELIYQENGVTKKMNASVSGSWGDIHTGEANDCYILNVGDGSTSTGSGSTAGTGYNDIIVAKEGSYTYDAGGGTIISSDVATWQTNGGLDVIDFKLATSGVTVDLSNTGAHNTGFNTVTLKNIEGVYGTNFADTLSGSATGNVIEGRGGDDIITISQGGHDTLLYRLISSASNDGGVGHDVVTGFKSGAYESTADTSRIDIHELLSGYSGTGTAHYINNVATLDGGAGNITDFVKVVQNGDNVDIQIDRDGSGNANNFTTIATLNNVHTDLATLLANHQLIVA